MTQTRHPHDPGTPCDEPGCLHNHQAVIAQSKSQQNPTGTALILTLRHEFEDQFVGVTTEGVDYCRESADDWQPHLYPKGAVIYDDHLSPLR